MSDVDPRDIAPLDDLARTDPAVAPLARMQATAFHEAANGRWALDLPDLASAMPAGAPLLDGRTLPVDAGRLAALLDQIATLAGVALRIADNRGDALSDRRSAGNASLDPVALLAASINHDTAAVAALAVRLGVAAGALATVAAVAALPLLTAVRAQTAALLDGQAWEWGFCPVCSAWPALEERRGLERQRWPRCGRCGAGWNISHDGCAFCGTTDHRALAYLAPEGEGEARRALTCDACGCYIKSLATLAPLSHAGVAFQDLSTLELDIAALERGYGRPEQPGRSLTVTLVPAAAQRPDTLQRAEAQSGGGYRRWLKRK